MGRWDLLKIISLLASRVTKWSPNCDRALHRVISYIHCTLDTVQWCYVAKDSTLDTIEVQLHADADLAGERPSFRSTSGNLLSIQGKFTDFLVSCRSKTEKFASCSTPESELASASRGMRAMAMPALDLLDFIAGRPVPMTLREDNEAAISIIRSGKNPT